jgi:Tol biopolymer transport system component/DNA-binding winged helix-turn-helix (wHTH) protein
LETLLSHAGETVTRAELHSCLWPNDTFVDFDQGLNVAIKKLRDALCDSPVQPSYIVTVPGIGYRFIAPVQDYDEAPAVPSSSRIAAAAVDSSSVALLEAPADTAEAVPPAKAASQTFYKFIALAAILLLITVFAVWRWPIVHRAALSPLQATISLTPDLRLMTEGATGGLALSPDGSRVVFSALGADGRTALWLRRLDSLDPIRLPGTEDSLYPFWSPDGTRIGFITDLDIKQLNLADNSVSVIAKAESARGASWSRDDKILFASSTRSGISVISAQGGTVTQVTKLEAKQYTTQRWPVWLADGKHFVFLAANHDSVSIPAALYLASTDGSAPKFLAESDSNAVVIGDSLLFLSHGKLIRQTLHLDSDELDPNATIVAERVGYDPRVWFGNFSAGSDVLVYSPRSQTSGEQIVWLDRNGKQRAPIGPRGLYQAVVAAPKGNLLAVLCGDPNTNVCVLRTDGSLNQLTNDPIASSLVWSPDASAIAYEKHQSESSSSIVVKPLRSDLPETIVASSQTGISPFAWHPDGRHLLLARAVANGLSEVVSLDLTSGKSQPFLPAAARQVWGRFSPDGHWIAFDTAENGKDEVYVVSFPRASIRYRLAAGASPRWRADGRELFFLATDNTINVVSVAPKPQSLTFGTPQPLFRPPIVPAPWNRDSYDVSADGQRFVVNTIAEDKNSELIVIAGWQH